MEELLAWLRSIGRRPKVSAQGVDRMDPSKAEPSQEGPPPPLTECPCCEIPLVVLPEPKTFIPWGINPEETAPITVDKQCPRCKLLFN